MCRATAAAAARSSAVTSAVLGAVRPADHVAVSRIESKPACCASVIFASGAPHFAASSTAPIFSDGPATAAGAQASAPSSTDTTTLTPNTPSEGGGRDSNPRPPGPQPGALPTELPPPRVPKGSAQFPERLVDVGRSGLPQLLLREPAGHHADRLDPGPFGRLHVPRRVPDHDRPLRVQLLERGTDEIRVGLRRLDVVLRRPAVGQLLRVDQLDEVVEMLLDRARREHNLVAPLLQRDEQVVRAVERGHFVDHAVELLFPGVAHVAAHASLCIVAGNGGDELVAAHADVTMQPPDRDRDPEAPERAIPAECVLVVRVDERA